MTIDIIDAKARVAAFVQWAEKFWASTDQNTFTTEQAEVNLRFLLIEKQDPEYLSVMLDKIKNGPQSEVGFALKLISKRADFIGLKINAPAMIMLSTMCDTPGEAVMWLYALRYHQARTPHLQQNGVTLEDFSRLLISGWPSDAQLEALWDAQKIGGVNLLDTLNPVTDFELEDVPCGS
jgi:hypothetical protein